METPWSDVVADLCRMEGQVQGSFSSHFPSHKQQQLLAGDKEFTDVLQAHLLQMAVATVPICLCH